MTTAEFNSLFQPISGVPPILSSYESFKTPNAPTGFMASQVFQGTGVAAGLYAYAYQLAVNNLSDSSGQPTSVDSASLTFSGTPAPAAFTSGATPSAAYVITDGTVGGVNLPQAVPGSIIQTPTSLAWMPGNNSGSLTFQYLDAAQNTGPLLAGSNSATVVVLSKQPYVEEPVSIQNANPQIAFSTVYAASNGTNQPVPVPEPSTVISWAGMIGAVALIRHVRKSRLAARSTKCH
jgi:hypothetical protein